MAQLKTLRRTGQGLVLWFVVAILPTVALGTEPLKIAYSDWPGWVAWEIAIQKEWFKEADVDVEFHWMRYIDSINAFVENEVDAVCMTNGDALTIGASGKPSVGIIINDYSNGNDMIVAQAGIESVRELKGKKVGVEEGFVSHLLLMKALELNGLRAKDVVTVNLSTEQTPEALAKGEVSAISAWQPHSGTALERVEGSQPIFTSADAPGLIYDLLYVDPTILEARWDDWNKVAQVWYRVVDYLKADENLEESLRILAKRVELEPQDYKLLFEGTYILSREEALKCWNWAENLNSIYGSTMVSNDFNVRVGLYPKALNVSSYLDSTITRRIPDD